MNTEPTLAALNPSELVVAGGLVRMIVRADGDFSPIEEAWLDALTAELTTHSVVPGRGALWAAVSESAQRFPTSEDVLQAALSIRVSMRPLVLALLSSVAAADRVSAQERDVLSLLRKMWTL